MGASAALSEGMIVVEPGSEAGLEIRVRNESAVVDQFTIDVLGEPARWATVEPSTVSLFPDAEGVARVSFRPPRSPEALAEAVPFGVKVSSHEDPLGVTVEEGILQIAPFADASADLIPRTSRARFQGRHQLAIDNRGNYPLSATMGAADPDNLLTFQFTPEALTDAQPGTASFIKLTAKPRKRFLRGQPQTRPFQVRVEPEGAMPLTVDATLLQEPIIPAWLPKAIMAAVGLTVLAAIAWLALLKPVVKTTATQVVRLETSGLKDQVAGLNGAMGQVLQALAGGGAGGGGGGTAGTGNDKAGAQKGGQPPPGQLPKTDRPFIEIRNALPGDPVDFRLTPKSDDNRGKATDEYPVPKDKQLALTDIFLQNPQGDRGDLEVRREADGKPNQVLIRTNLANFRDLDYHFVTPAIIGEGQKLVLEVACKNGEPPPTTSASAPRATPTTKSTEKPLACAAAAYFNGTLAKPPPPPQALSSRTRSPFVLSTVFEKLWPRLR